MFVPLVEVTRGRIVESLHVGAIAVVDSRGRLIAAAGDPAWATFLRSSAKPFQALPLVESGAATAYGLDERELAVACASHSGSPAHQEAVRSLQRKAGVQPEDLLCGTHPVGDRAEAERLMRAGQPPTSLHHNCSGKHSAMLALARYRWGGVSSPEGHSYIDPAGALQQEILGAFAAMCAVDPAQVEVGIDGCSAPNFAVPLERAAHAAARLMDPAGLEEARQQACASITAAMMTHPEMVAGEGRFDTVLIRAGHGRWIAKAGAEGYQLIGVRAGAAGRGAPALGIALKVSDGDTTMRTEPLGESPARAAPLVAIEVLRQLRLLDEEDQVALAGFDQRPLTNWRGLTTGEIRPAFVLD